MLSSLFIIHLECYNVFFKQHLDLHSFVLFFLFLPLALELELKEQLDEDLENEPEEEELENDLLLRGSFNFLC